ncbi:MAG: NarK family nitrate/nitrite MFS transporter [Planctomycetes bacterium]|nr:NarK family nitrate/nitrite MFS transporter [Planctomycetota bacterium]
MSNGEVVSKKEFNPLRFLSFSGPYKILHLTWFAFFLTFVAWFNMAAVAPIMIASEAITKAEFKILMICNVALTVPARIIIGMVLDKFGPRICYTALMLTMAIPCLVFAFSETTTQLVISRLLLSVVGAGFVIGIRMTSEWFPPKDVGEAEGIYGGFGNFGSAAAAWTLPTIALYAFGGDDGWRYSIAFTGILLFVYGFIYFYTVKDTPEGKTYQRPKKLGAMEVTSWSSYVGLILMQIPMFGALVLMTFKLQTFETGLDAAGNPEYFLPTQVAHIVYGLLFGLFALQVYKIWEVNVQRLREGVPEKEKFHFRQVAVLDFSYFCNFGSELAVVSMLPVFFVTTWALDPQWGGWLAGSFAFMNLFARPMGGFLSDRLGSRKKTLTVLTGGLAVGYLLMALLDGRALAGFPVDGSAAAADVTPLPLILAVAIVMLCSFFVQAGEGATFAMVPLVKKRITGQVAGMAGAYGNVGAVTFLTVFSFVEPSEFFLFIGICALVCTVACLFLDEPKGSFAETHHDDVIEEAAKVEKEELAAV